MTEAEWKQHRAEQKAEYRARRKVERRQGTWTKDKPKYAEKYRRPRSLLQEVSPGLSVAAGKGENPSLFSFFETMRDGENTRRNFDLDINYWNLF